MKKIICLTLALLLFSCGCSKKAPESGCLKVVATVFPAYDFARAVAGDLAEVSMLLDPGTEIHSFEPSAEDILEIKSADIFIYTGGESDTWIEDVLSSLNPKDTTVLKMTEHSSLLYEEGHTHADEHVWLSPKNAESIIMAIAAAASEKDAASAQAYSANAEAYCAEIEKLANQTKELISLAPKREIVVADRFPLRYFCDFYNLDWLAAFDACDLFADADAKTVISLINRIKDKDLRLVFYIENGSGYLADTVCEETGADKLIINTMHTVTLEDFSSGVTYLDIMRQNYAALERGLY